MNQLLLEMFQTSHLPTRSVETVKVTGLGTESLDMIEAINFLFGIFFAPIFYSNKRYKFGFYNSPCSINIVDKTAMITVDATLLSIYNEYVFTYFKAWLDGQDPYINRSYVLYENEKARLCYYLYSFSDLYYRNAALKVFNFLLNGGAN